MSGAAVISAIKAVIAIVKVVRRIHDLHADNATSTITLNDFNHIVTGSNAQFFADIAISDIRMIDNRFRNVWLPTVLGYARRGREILPEDLENPAGALWSTFNGLEVASRDLDINLNRLRIVFERYHSRLHIDELVRGFFACLNGYGLLLHMHAVRTELRRIQIRATTFDDHRLVDYTRFALQYLFDGIALLDGFPEPIWNRRRDLIGSLRELWNPVVGGSLWTFDDNYTPLRSTTSDITLTFSRYTPGDTDRHRAERARHEYIGRALDRVNAVGERKEADRD
ncbi:hypothetical protein ONZ45_g18920 [Pleurotus djamor]|nr:hypothetical protein ONZ45_g18920 [Pleurotus djamor]